MLKLKDLTKEQVSAVDWLFNYDETLFVAPKGFGKCIVAYTALTELIKNNHLKRILVLSTAQVCTQVWAKEAENWEHIPNDDFVCLTGQSGDQRKKLMDKNTPIVICNFENLAWLMVTYGEAVFDGLLIDEITKLKSVGGVGFKKLRNKLKHFKWRVGMTADPVAQESIEIYGQMLIIDMGARLGRNKDNFRRNYFMQMDYMGYKWEFQPGGLERLTEKLSDVIYKVESEEYEMALPDLVDNGISVSLPKDVRTFYKKLISKHVATTPNGTEISVPSEAVLQGKLHQICCGGIYSQDEFETKKEYHFLHDAKMAALDSLIKAYDTPKLIAYQYNFQKDALVEKYGYPVFSASNGIAKNDKLLKAWEKGELNGMLIHPKSAGHGLNLQYGPCNILICFSYFWSADEWDQLLGRILRRGQKAKTVYRYTFYCADTIEDCVMKPNLIERKDASKLFNNYINRLKR